MGAWQLVTGTVGLVARTARQTLAWSEHLTPWPLSLVPRVLRLPLDLLTPAHAPAPAGVPPAAPRGRRGAEPARAPSRGTPKRGEARPPQRRTDARPSEEPRTATIAGARSEGPDDAPRYDREFRARLAPLYTRDAGKGPAIVLLHAFPLNSRMWEPQLEGLSDRFRVVAPDLAGFGLSWTPDASFSLADQAGAIEDTLEDLKIDEVILVGLSLGGYVAFPLLPRLGERVRGLVLADTRSSADSEAAATDRHRLAAEVEENGVDAAASELLPKLLGTSTLHDQPELLDRVLAIARENKVPGVAGTLRAMAARPDSTGQLARIHCPVLVLVGEDDVVTPPSVAREMAKRIPSARVEVLPRAGHLSNLEAPDDFNRALAEFADTAGQNARATASRARKRAGAGR